MTSYLLLVSPVRVLTCKETNAFLLNETAKRIMYSYMDRNLDSIENKNLNCNPKFYKKTKTIAKFQLFGIVLSQLPILERTK